MEAKIIPIFSDIRKCVESNVATDDILSDEQQDLLDQCLKEISDYYCTLDILRSKLDADSEHYETYTKEMAKGDDVYDFIIAIIDRSNQLKEEK